jgi:hypothetical protein
MLLLSFNDKTQMVAIRTICGVPNGAPIEEKLNSIIFKEVLNGNVCFFVVNEMDFLVQECL